MTIDDFMTITLTIFLSCFMLLGILVVLSAIITAVLEITHFTYRKLILKHELDYATKLNKQLEQELHDVDLDKRLREEINKRVNRDVIQIHKDDDLPK